MKEKRKQQKQSNKKNAPGFGAGRLSRAFRPMNILTLLKLKKLDDIQLRKLGREALIYYFQLPKPISRNRRHELYYEVLRVRIKRLLSQPDPDGNKAPSTIKRTESTSITPELLKKIARRASTNALNENRAMKIPNTFLKGKSIIRSSDKNSEVIGSL